jgi:hypothetical protein
LFTAIIEWIIFLGNVAVIYISVIALIIPKEKKKDKINKKYEGKLRFNLSR